MIAQLRGLAQRLEQPWARRLLLVLFAAVATAFTLIPLLRFMRSGTQFDYHTWFEAAQAVLHGREIYPRTGTFPFMYPPTCALFLAIPAALGKAAMILLLGILNTGAWILCINFCLRLVQEPRFRTALALLSNLIVIVFVWSSYHLGQPSLLLLALVLGAFVSLSRDRQIPAGALLALASAIKAFPFLAIVYLIYRRYWLAALSLLGSLFLLLVVLPMPFRGVQQTMADLRAWQSGMLRYQQGGIAQRAGRSYSWKNQSIFGLANRMLRRVSVNDEGEPAEYANIANLNFTTVNAVIVGMALLAGCSFILAMPHKRAGESDALECSALLILILLFTPLAFGYLFSWLMLPLMMLMKRILNRASAPTLLCLLAAIALLIVTAVWPRGAQIYGSVFFAGLALYFGVAIELWRAGNVAGAGGAER